MAKLSETYAQMVAMEEQIRKSMWHQIDYEALWLGADYAARNPPRKEYSPRITNPHNDKASSRIMEALKTIEMLRDWLESLAKNPEYLGKVSIKADFLALTDSLILSVEGAIIAYRTQEKPYVSLGDTTISPERDA